MQIGDLPHFGITQVDAAAGQVRLAGTFTTLAGVREGRCWLLMPDHSIIGDLADVHTSAKSASFMTPETVAAQIPLGASFPWLDGYWQAYLVRRIADPT